MPTAGYPGSTIESTLESIGTHLPEKSGRLEACLTFHWSHLFLALLQPRAQRLARPEVPSIWASHVVVIRGVDVTNSDFDLLTKVLLDGTAEFGDRDEAAMTLAWSDLAEAELALLSIATDTSADADLSDRCGESLARIWSRQGRADADTLARLNIVARRVAVATIYALSPALSEELARQGLSPE